MVDPATAYGRQQQQRQSQQTALQHPSGPDVAHVESDQHGDGDGGSDGGGRPGAVLHRVDHGQGERRDQDHQDHEGAQQSRGTRHWPQFIACHLPQAAPIAPQRAEHDDHVLHTAAQHCPDQDPQGTG